APSSPRHPYPPGRPCTSHGPLPSASNAVAFSRFPPPSRGRVRERGTTEPLSAALEVWLSLLGEGRDALLRVLGDEDPGDGLPLEGQAEVQRSAVAQLG